MILSPQSSSTQVSSIEDGHSSHWQGSHFDTTTGVYVNSTAEQNFRIPVPTLSDDIILPPNMNVTLDDKKRVALSEPEPFKGLPPMELMAEGLDSVDNETLRQSIDPIWKSLESIDAAAMLNLKIVEDGARVSDGYVTLHHICTKSTLSLSLPRTHSLVSIICFLTLVCSCFFLWSKISVFCQPIHDQVMPIKERRGSCVRYVHISEVPDKYSVGIFIFPPHARIPLHDHPGMCVLSRVLYGDLERISLDLMRDNNNTNSNNQQMDAATPSSSSSWFQCWSRTQLQQQQQLPHGVRRAYLNEQEHLEAPDVAVLYPYEGNLHEFIAGPNGAAVLDVLLPPYDEEDHKRECTFYHICEQPVIKGPCWIVPTNQPEDFHCLSGHYGELGYSDEYEEE